MVESARNLTKVSLKADRMSLLRAHSLAENRSHVYNSSLCCCWVALTCSMVNVEKSITGESPGLLGVIKDRIFDRPKSLIRLLIKTYVL